MLLSEQVNAEADKPMRENQSALGDWNWEKSDNKFIVYSENSHISHTAYTSTRTAIYNSECVHSINLHIRANSGDDTLIRKSEVQQ